MAVAMEKESQRRLPVSFRCKTKKRIVLLTKCLDNYVDINAKPFKKMHGKIPACWLCSQGRAHRKEFASHAC